MSDDFQWWSAMETAAAIRSGAVSRSEITDAAILRIERLDPQLGAVVIPLFERARELGADAIGALFRGVPMLLKDAGEELAGTSHWVGTLGLARAGYRSETTTELAQQFERLGFVFVGKSACPELSASSTTEPAGFAPTRNPWDVDRTVGGSSGGSAAAVAAGMVPIAHGTDGTGSLRFPASHCGVVTLKPSRGRIPQTPPTGQVDPLHAWTQFALARDVNDLCALFPLLARGESSRIMPWHSLRVGLLDHDPIIGLPVAQDCAQAVHSLGDAMVLLGHHVELSHPPALATLFRPFWKAMAIIGPVLRFEQVQWMSKRLGRMCQPGDVTEEVFELAERGRSISAVDLAAAYENVRVAMSGIGDWWNSGFDILATPVMLEPAWKLGDDAPAKTGMFCARFSFTGQPALVVPVSMTATGLPVGVQLVGRHSDDEMLLALGSQLQTAFGWLDRDPDQRKEAP
jgi:Asp-tRNA(Asn)/Glu-tRNA(Gln) amidotransferase A subunit family amidase